MSREIEKQVSRMLEQDDIPIDMGTDLSPADAEELWTRLMLCVDQSTDTEKQRVSKVIAALSLTRDPISLLKQELFDNNPESQVDVAAFLGDWTPDEEEDE